MATKVQRKSLWHMIQHGGRALILSGRKSTRWLTVDNPDRAIINGSLNLLLGLLANGWVERDDHPSVSEACQAAYKITEKGIRAAGKSEPEMKATRHGNHGIRWA